MKPIYDIQWATSDVTTGISGNPNKLEPFDFKAEGQQEGQPVPRQYLNFQFDAIRQWKDYLEDVTDTLLSSSANYLSISNNLSDLNNTATARTNLGLNVTATYPVASQIQSESGTSDVVLVTPLRNQQHFESRTTAFTRTLLSRATSDAVRGDLGLGTAALSNSGDFVSSTVSVIAGNGITGGGQLTTSRTLTLGTPSTIGNGSTNSVTSTSHTHAISLATTDIPNLDASKITSGTFPTTRIPNLDTSKITTGIFLDARIPSLDAGKITTGTFNVTRIPDLDTSKITTGTLSTARLSGTYNISVSGNAATVTNGVYTTGNQSIGGTKTFTSTVFAPSFRISSDPSLKDNMVDHEPVDNLDLIKLKSWVWGQSEYIPEQLRGKADSGVDASAVEKVFPSCVERDVNGKLTVDYGKLAVHLILAKGV